MNDTYKLRIRKGEDELEAEGDREFVLDMLGRFESNLSSPADPVDEKRESPKIRQAKTESNVKPESVREFIQKLAYKRHTERVLAFGYYLEKNAGKSAFTPADINNCYYEAKMETSNTSQSIINNIKKGLIMEAKGGTKGKKKYILTQSGEDQVEKRIATAK